MSLHITKYTAFGPPNLAYLGSRLCRSTARQSLPSSSSPVIELMEMPNLPLLEPMLRGKMSDGPLLHVSHVAR